MLAAPTAPDERLPRVCDRARGFVYAVGLLGVTGERDALALERDRDRQAAEGDHRQAGARRRRHVQRPSRRCEARRGADGVIIGSALVRRLLDGEGPEGVGRFVGDVRRALDE